MSHRALILTFGLAGFAASFATRLTDPLVAVLALDFAADPARVALLATAFALPFALVQPVLGPVADAWGKQRVIRFALAFQAVFLFASALAPALLVLLVLRALTGMAGGGIFPVTLALFGDRVPMAERQVAISRFLAFAIAGQMMGGFAAGVLEPILGWRGLMALCGAASAVAALVVWRDRAAPEPRGVLSLGGALSRYRALLSHRPATRLFRAVGVEGMLVFGAFPFFANHLYESGMGGTREAGFTVAAFGCGGFLYAMLAPLLVRRLGPWRMMRLGAGLAALAMLGLAAASGAAPFVSAGLLLGLGFFMLHNTLQTRATEVAPQARASVVALHAFHFFLGQAAGPLLYGALRATLGLPFAMLLAAIGLGLLGWIMGRPGTPGEPLRGP
ncbi:MFS transporter [Sabulicella glaciei]|uniref:MFS transporter n=1 Tax=Sabulicella glaciei TaxID=2984948 RepID=A0ABT3NX44_9PROT|nr:MFS transporter [Roseococcus sp. MDT2-1-1]